MQNNRPVNDPNLQMALSEIKAIMLKHDLAGAAMLVSPTEAAFTYGMFASWSALRPDPNTPLGVRFTAQSQRDGKELTQRRIEGALHTICQLCDFGTQTEMWMEDFKEILRAAGVDFDHVSFGGQELPHLGAMKT